MRKWIRRILKGVSLTTALFVFQACYGTPVPDPNDQLRFEDETELVDRQVVEDAEMLPEAEAAVIE